MKNNTDKMPDRFSPEFEFYEERLMKLSAEDFFRLFELVGIRFSSEEGPNKNASLEELMKNEDIKDTYIEIFDEADSRKTIDDYLKERGLYETPDKMPNRRTREFKAYEKRLMKLPAEDFFRLFELVGIRFPVKRNLPRRLTWQELAAKYKNRKDGFVEIFDEADSRAKIDAHLAERGL